MGKTPAVIDTQVSSATIEDLNNQIKKFWELESFSSSNHWSMEERECEDHFVRSTVRTEGGRYVVSLPLRSMNKDLSDSKQNALRQLYNLERSFSTKPILKQQYHDFMREYIQLAHMKPVKDDSQSSKYSPSYYMPHHGVGPTVQEDLLSILMHFRVHTHVIKADIAEMYRQILIREEERPLHRILWRFDRSQLVQRYELCTVTYGTASAPFLATRALNQVALDEVHISKEASSKVLSDFYVDDLPTGAPTIEEAKALRRNITNILNCACLELRKWSSNDSKILVDINSSHLETSCEVSLLGLLWKSYVDNLKIPTHNLKVYKSHTKRRVLSTIASIYDPLGLCAPVTFLAKCFMQTLWAHPDIRWDDILPSALIEQWDRFTHKLPILSDIIITRCAIPVPALNLREVQLHCFGDASEKGYGCCIYVRSTGNDGKHFVRLLCGKSRVAPLRKSTIPRLELCASLLVAQLADKVISSLKIQFNRIYFWTDSEITLYRIKSTSSKYVTFVANRISQIQELTSTDNWYHITSDQYPADVVSRGLLPSYLLASERWWNGPHFITQDERLWPAQKLHQPEMQCLELRKEVLESMTTNSNRVDIAVLVTIVPNYDYISKFSNLNKLLRCVAIWLKYFQMLKDKGRSALLNDITAVDIDIALKRILVVVQHQMFPEVIKNLKAEKKITRSSKLFNLNAFMDTSSIMRIGGRLRNTDQLSCDQKFPIVLERKHHFTTPLVRHEHRRNLHAGPLALLNHIRQRIQPARAFVNIGVDFFGPMFITQRIRGRSPIKTYAAIFVCFSTKAVHIELVENLTTAAFISTLRCFISWRVHPANIYCDNASNFIGARNELFEWYKLISSTEYSKAVQRFSTDEQINWHHIPTRSPHHGGLWEAAVKSAKHHLRRIMGIHIFTSMELRTLLVQVEACLNSRPLHPMSSDPSDLAPLTPGHFLIGAP